MIEVIARTGARRYLNIGTLKDNVQVNCLAFVYNIKIDTAITGNDYCKIWLKDVNANVIMGVVFGIEKLKERGLNFLILKNKAVSIVATCNKYEGNFSLKIEDIKMYTDNDFEYEKFIGKVDNADALYDECKAIYNRVLDKEINIPIQLKTVSVQGIDNGRVGGFIRLFHMGLYRLLTLTEIPGINMENVFKLYRVVALEYFNYKQKLTTIDVDTNAERMAFMLKSSRRVESFANSDLIADALCPLLKITDANHLESTLVSDAIMDAEKWLDYANSYSSTPEGGMVRCRGKQFVKLQF